MTPTTTCGTTWARALLTVTFLLATGGPAVAEPQRSSLTLLQPVSQERTVSGSAFAEDLDDSLNDQAFDEAVDFGPFQTAVAADASVAGALGSGGAILDSTIGASSIFATGSHFSNAEGYDFDAYADASGASRLTVTFDVPVATSFVLQGQIAAFDGGGVDVLLTDGQGASVYSAFAFGPAEEVLLDGGGSIDAGRYTLTIDASGNSFGDAFTFGYSFSDFTVDFRLSVDGPGGAVPDGVTGPPLRVDRAADGRVRLNWGSSCRLQDTDYAIYEGDLTAPADLTPAVCTTGGFRDAELTPTHTAAFFLVVPHDGSREGSYGVESSGAQRPTPLSACYPQALGKPICP